MLNNIKIGTRLVIGFASLLVLLALISFFFADKYGLHERGN